MGARDHSTCSVSAQAPISGQVLPEQPLLSLLRLVYLSQTFLLETTAAAAASLTP